MKERIAGIRRQLDDPIVASSWVAGALVLAGFVAVVLGWRGVAGTLAVPVQVPYLVSGGLGGLALIVGAGTIVNVQITRHLAAREREMLDTVIDDAREVVAALRSTET